MVDRAARDRMADLIERYLDEEITAFELDEGLSSVHATSDPTVEDVRWMVWRCYDDLVDHKVVATKEQWDWLQRLVVLLRSDGHIEKTWDVRECPCQAAAAAGLLLVGGIAIFSGIPYYITGPLLGVATLFLWRRHSLEEQARERPRIVIEPFSSVAQLLSVRRRVSGFTRRPYPDHLRTRHIRGPLANWVIPWWLLCLVLAPLALLYLALPHLYCETRVVLPEGQSPGPASV